MGSLMAGWDATPKSGELQDPPEWLKKIRASGDSPTHLSRRHSGGPGHAANDSPTSRGKHGFDASSSPRGSDAHDDLTGDPLLDAARRNVQRTRSGRPFLERASASSYFASPHSIDGEPKACPDDTNVPLLHTAKVAWWKHMDSSELNAARTDVPADYRTGSYMPQGDVAHVHHNKENHKQGSVPEERSVEG